VIITAANTGNAWNPTSSRNGDRGQRTSVSELTPHRDARRLVKRICGDDGEALTVSSRLKTWVRTSGRGRMETMELLEAKRIY
jgi:hypothetical protein